MPSESIQTKIEPGEISIKIQLPEIPTSSNSHTKTESSFKAPYGGVILDFIVETNSLLAQDGTMDSSVNIDVSDKLSFPANIFITFHKGISDLEYIANTNVRNNSRELRGLGRALWILSIKLMQEFSNKTNVPVRHLMVKNPTKGLEEDKWDELFQPLLKANNYQEWKANKPDDRFRAENTPWAKVYKPADK